MVNSYSANLDLVFYALSDPTRRQMLRMLSTGVQTVGELAHPFDMSLAAVSKHVKILEKAKLLKRKRLGRIHECSLDTAALKTVEEYVQFYTRFWNERLDSFTKDLESESKAKKRRKSYVTRRQS